MTTQERIDELKQCSAWETHVSSLEALALKMDSELSEQTNEVARLREEIDELKLSEAALAEELKISDDWLKHTRNEVARLRELMRDYIDFIDENMGTTADWFMEAACYDEEICQRYCDLFNAMKREVKTEDIN